MKSRMRVALMYGGVSNEHEISQRSAYSVLSAIDNDKFEVIAIGGNKKGQWFQTPLPSLLAESNERLAVVLSDSKEIQLTPDFFKTIDVALPIVHGPWYEDGCLQGVLELCDVAYVGSNVQGSAIAMDKVVTKQLAKLHGVDVADYCYLNRQMSQEVTQAKLKKTTSDFSYPLFVKPVHTGSSVGVQKAVDEKSLNDAIKDAFRFDDKILIERAIKGREIEIAILEEKGEVVASDALGEIVMSGDDFYSYEAKYLSENKAQLIAPAKLSSAWKEKIKTAAIGVFKALELNDLARIDFFLCDETKKVVLNEVNTLPGFTSISMYPKLWQLSGVTYQALISRLIENALWRYEQRKNLLRDYK